MNDLNHSEIPDDVREVAHGLDRLAAAERDAAPAGFEARMASAARAGLEAGPSLRLAGEAAPAGRTVIARIGLWRIAAAVAIVGLGVGAIVGLRPSAPAGGSALALDVDELLNNANVLDDALAHSDQLDSLFGDLDSVSSSMTSEPILTEPDISL